jgi:hypothetical protein
MGARYTPGSVDADRSGELVTKAGLLATADAVLNAGVWAVAGFEELGSLAGSVVAASW